MKINIDELYNFNVIDIDTVTAKYRITDDTVTVKRVLRGWKPVIQISCNGILCREFEPDAFVKDSFTLLMETARCEREHMLDVTREKNNTLMSKIFGL